MLNFQGGTGSPHLPVGAAHTAGRFAAQLFYSNSGPATDSSGRGSMCTTAELRRMPGQAMQYCDREPVVVPWIGPGSPHYARPVPHQCDAGRTGIERRAKLIFVGAFLVMILAEWLGT